MKVIFLGTPEFAVPVLDALIKSHHNVVAVVTQPDREVGRGRKIEMPPVKILANEHNIPVFQFSSIKKQGVEILKSLNADVMVTCAYGQILNQAVLDITKHGVINVHGSLLPKYRGASPIQCAIINGETKTGVTIMKTALGIDCGDMLLQKSCDILPTDSTEMVLDKVSKCGAEIIVSALDQIETNKAKFVPQNEIKATYFKMFEKQDGKIDFNKSATEIANFVRGINPWPGAFFVLGEETFKVFKITALTGNFAGENGEILEASAKNGLIIKCSGGAVAVEEIQAPNSKRMTARAYLNGKKIEVGNIAK